MIIMREGKMVMRSDIKNAPCQSRDINRSLLYVIIAFLLLCTFALFLLHPQADACVCVCVASRERLSRDCILHSRICCCIYNNIIYFALIRKCVLVNVRRKNHSAGSRWMDAPVCVYRHHLPGIRVHFALHN